MIAETPSSIQPIGISAQANTAWNTRNTSASSTSGPSTRLSSTASSRLVTRLAVPLLDDRGIGNGAGALLQRAQAGGVERLKAHVIAERRGIGQHTGQAPAQFVEPGAGAPQRWG